MDSGKILLGVLAGVAAGAAIGVLFAPEKGSVTRRKISRKGEDYAEDLKSKFNHFVEEMKMDLADLKDKANALVEEEVA